MFLASLFVLRFICSLAETRPPFYLFFLISLQVGKMAQVVHMTKGLGFQVLSGSASLLLPALTVGESTL
jgi:hypothetical protein